MDPDAPPLVKADFLASQGEQLSSRRAYQQAHQAHTEAAKQYQLAAQVTSDTGAAKALLLQRDKQLKLASEALRKLERGKSKPASTASTTATTSAAATTTSQPSNSSRSQAAASTSAYRPYAGANSPVGHHHHGPAYRRTTTMQQQQQQPITSVYQPYNPARMGSNGNGNTGAFIPPRDRIDASSTLADSRYSRKSNSPSQSQISQSIPMSGESAKTSSVEESYYLMNTDNDPTDPVTTFLTVVENMVEELGNAVAFASAPLHIGPPVAKSVGVSASSHSRQNSSGEGGPSKAEFNKGSSITKQAGSSNQVLESFYVVPSINRPGKVARGASTNSPSAAAEDGQGDNLSRPNSAINKTHEELVAENATLKETLDHLSKRLDWITKERQREKETLKDSVTIFARDVRRQAERLGQSTANLADTRRQMPPIPLNLQSQAHHYTPSMSGNSTNVEDLQRKLAQAQEETRLAKAEAEKQAGIAQKYKVRYDDLRKAIIEKRKAKELANAAAASSTTTKAGEEVAVIPSKDASGKESNSATENKVASGT